MSLESIVEHILSDAQLQAEDIIRQAKLQAEDIIRQAKLQAEALRKDTLEIEKSLCDKKKQKIAVNARIESKKDLLRIKQELIDAVFGKIKSVIKKDKLKKEQVSCDKTHEVAEDVDFYLHKIRLDYESEIAKILFG